LRYIHPKVNTAGDHCSREPLREPGEEVNMRLINGADKGNTQITHEVQSPISTQSKLKKTITTRFLILARMLITIKYSTLKMIHILFISSFPFLR